MRMEIWTYAINFVICVSRHFEFGSGHTQEGTCQRALHQFILCAWFKLCSLDFVQSINLGKLWLSHTVACKTEDCIYAEQF